MKLNHFHTSFAPSLGIACSILLHSSLLAQHATDVLIARSDPGMIQVGSVGNRDLTTRVFHDVFTSSFDADDPGFNSTVIPAGALALPPNELLWIDFVPFLVGDGEVASLFSWDGNGSVQFSPAPATYELLVKKIQREVTVKTHGNEPVPIAAGIIDDEGEIHEHLSFSLSDGDEDMDTIPNQGIYLFGAQARVTGFESSDPFFIAVTSLEIGPPQRDAADEWLATNVGYFTLPSLPGDFDNDSVLTANDIDLLSASVQQGANDVQFDLTSDQIVDEDDRQVWFTLANTLPGDANLDGGVMFDDFSTLSNNFGQPGRWKEGDFSGNARVDFADFTLLSNNFGQAVMTVPEPKGFPIVTFLPMLFRYFQKSKGAQLLGRRLGS